MHQKTKYYKLLGLSTNATLREIKKAYRKKALLYHPDRNQSPDAEDKFIALTEAYEILTNQRPQPKSAVKPKTAEEIRREKVKVAKARYAAQQKRESAKDLAYFKQLTSGWKWKAYKIASYICLSLAILLMIDHFTVGEQSFVDRIDSYGHMNQTIELKGETFVIPDNVPWIGRFPPMMKSKTIIFKETKSIQFLSAKDFITLEFLNNTKKKSLLLFEQFPLVISMKANSRFSYYPLMQLILIIPFFIYKFKRPTFQFVTWRLLSIYICFPLGFYVLFFNERVLEWLNFT